MRPLSRLLSVFLALILMAAGVLTVSGHGDDRDDTGDLTPGSGGSTATITIHRVDGKSDIHVGTVLEFLVIVERGKHDLENTAMVSSVNAGSVAAFPIGDDVDGSLYGDGNNSVVQFEKVKYKITAMELGAAQERMVPIKLQLTIMPGELGTYTAPADDAADGTLGTWTALPTAGADDAHHDAHFADGPDDDTADDNIVITSEEVKVLVTKQATTGPGASEVEIDVTIERPDDLEAGEKVKFTVMARTGKYAVSPKSVVIRKQRLDEDGEDIGGNPPAVIFSLPALGTNSVSGSQDDEYTLVQDDLDADSVEFSYAVEITDGNLTPDPGEFYDTDKTQKGTFLLELPPEPTPEAMPEPTPEATPEPEPTPEVVGMNDDATVTRGDGNTINIDMGEGNVLRMSIGFLSEDGQLSPDANGYIRDDFRGQTYAVVNRESDGMVVRVWISHTSPYAGQIDWANVLAFYNVDTDVLNAIELDYTRPADRQLVKSGDPIYVYLAGAWRHIPNIVTFQANGYYWCDVAQAAEGWVERAGIQLGQGLPPSSGTVDPDYPSCR